jgi:hypothetical protein
VKGAAIIIAGLIGIAAPLPVTADIVAGPNSGLVGDWVLCKNPDKSLKDAMRFEPDDTGQVISAKGSTELVYRVRGARLEMLANAKGYAIPITLTIGHSPRVSMGYSEPSTPYLFFSRALVLAQRCTSD